MGNNKNNNLALTPAQLNDSRCNSFKGCVDNKNVDGSVGGMSWGKMSRGPIFACWFEKMLCKEKNCAPESGQI
jgi:hypothetical protein